MKLRTLLLATLLLGTACTRNNADADGDGKISEEEAAATVDTVKLTPGQWEAQTTVIDAKIEGAPAGFPTNVAESVKGQQNKTSTCISPEMAENPGSSLLAMREEVGCEYSQFDMRNGTISAEMTCTGSKMPGTMKVSLTGEYGPDSYNMMSEAVAENVNAAVPSMKMAVQSKVTGKRVGECAQ